MIKTPSLSLMLACAALLCASCSTTHMAKNSAIDSPGGTPIAHLNTSNFALHLFCSQPLLGNATLQGTVDDFVNAAHEEKATKVRIVQSDVTAWWLILPPFSFILTPVTSNVAGDALP